jgi:hypothetical protein
MTMRYSHLSDAYLRAAVNGVVLGGSDMTPAKVSELGTYVAPEDGVQIASAAK